MTDSEESVSDESARLIERHFNARPNQEVTLVIDPDGMPYNGRSGVRHEDCDRLAEVSPELDCAFCPDCHWQCRISGAWFMDLWSAR